MKDPSILHGYESLDTNFSWMRTVSPEEAKVSWERLSQWAKNPPASNGGLTGEWIFEAKTLKGNKTAHRRKHSSEIKTLKPVSADEIIKMSQSVELPEQYKKIEVSDEYPSLTPNVVQVHWRTPTEFPLCPQEKVENPLMEYKSQLIPGSVFCHNQYQDSLVLDTALIDNDTALYVICKSSDKGAVKRWALSKITYKNSIFYHENNGTFFRKDGAQKFFTLAQGKEWTGGTVFDELVM